VGSVNHVVSELFKVNARVNLTHIPYKGMSNASVALRVLELATGLRTLVQSSL
jgi:tripartite-type tricarboxylate transporter receptor subunit TctC